MNSGNRHQAFKALKIPSFPIFVSTCALTMTADNIEHVISYWVAFQKFHSPTLGGFAVISHWLPYLLLSAGVGALNDRFDSRRLIQIGGAMFMLTSLGWGYFACNKYACRRDCRRIAAELPQGMPLWDMLAAAVAMEPDLIRKSVEAYMDVAIDPGMYRGTARLWPKETRPHLGESKVRYVTEVDSARFLYLYVSAMAIK